MQRLTRSKATLHPNPTHPSPNPPLLSICSGIQTVIKHIWHHSAISGYITPLPSHNFWQKFPKYLLSSYFLGLFKCVTFYLTLVQISWGAVFGGCGPGRSSLLMEVSGLGWTMSSAKIPSFFSIPINQATSISLINCEKKKDVWREREIIKSVCFSDWWESFQDGNRRTAPLISLCVHPLWLERIYSTEETFLQILTRNTNLGQQIIFTVYELVFSWL